MTRSNSDEFKLLVDAVADPLVACDGQERIVHLTRPAERLLGWKREDLQGQPITALIPQRLHRVEGRSLLRYLLDRQPLPGGHSVLVPLQRHSGEELLLEVTVGHSGERERERIVLSLRPVPESPSFTPELFERDVALKRQRHMEEERVTQAALVDTLLHTAPIGMAFLDSKMRYVRINDMLARMNGKPAELHIGRRPSEVLGPGGALLEEIFQSALDSGKPLEKVEVTSEDLGFSGPKHFWAASLYPVHGKGNRLLGIGVIVEDVTERKEAEQERARLFREAQEAVRVRDDFLTVASHELKTPLTPLSLRLASLERRLENGQPVDPAALRHARQHLLRLTALINDLLDASRVESGGLALHPQPTQLDILTEHVIRVTEGSHDSVHRIDFHPPAKPLQVLGDPYRLEQVISNLLENALKYTPDGGTIHVSLEPRGDLALLAVRDPGIGIPTDQQQHLFERYFRARNVSTHSYGGLGLGLYICRDIVERHGGRIWVESEVGRGSTFYVALPTLKDSQPALEQASGSSLH